MIGWFVIPYLVRQTGKRPVRYVAIDDLKWVGGEQWEEWELPGDVAVVQVNAPSRILNRLGALYQRIPGSRQLENFIHSRGVWHVRHLHKDEWPQFNRPWPKKERTYPKGDHFYHDRVVIGEVNQKPVYAITGAAWPDNTTVVDDFNRGSLGTGWTTGSWNGDTAFSIISSTLLGNASEWGGGYYNAATYGPDIDIIVDYDTIGGSNYVNLIAKIQTGDPNDFYAFVTLPGESASSPQSRISRIDNNTETQLGATFLSEFVTGDKAGFEIIGTSNNLKAYKNHSGSWGSSLATRSDNTYPNAGYFGLEIQRVGDRLDNLTGGTVGGAADLSINKTDGVTIGESRTVTLADALAINKTDGITLGESAPVLLIDLISVTDGTTVGESSAVDITCAISVTDGITLGESAQEQVSSSLISVTDGTAVGESSAVDLVITAIATDAVTLGESAHEQVSSSQISVSDGAAIGESSTVDLVITAAATDAVTLGESAQEQVSSSQISVSDGTTVGESLAVDLVITANLTDAVTLGENTQQQASDPQISISDAITLGESSTVTLVAVGEMTISVAEAVNLGESSQVFLEGGPADLGIMIDPSIAAYWLQGVRVAG